MKRGRLLIRTIVRDIVQILKKSKSGLYYLPEDDNSYIVNKFPVDISVEVTLKKSSKIEDFIVNGYYSLEDDVIEILIYFNPKKLKLNLYNIIGELNEVVTHELQHSIQNYNGELIGEIDNSNLPPLEYYLQPEELDAQSKGFKRLSKLRNQPANVLIKQWFEKHLEIHKLTEKEQEIVINSILEYM